MGQLRGDGLAPPLAAYVFGRLLAEGRRAELLDLPQQVGPGHAGLVLEPRVPAGFCSVQVSLPCLAACSRSNLLLQLVPHAGALHVLNSTPAVCLPCSQFDEELHAWLADAAPDDAAQRSHLLWLHELRMHEYGSAAATLERLVGEAAPGQQPRLEALQRLAALAAVGEGAAF